MSKVIRAVLGILVIAGLAAGGYWYTQNRIAPNPNPARGGFTQVAPVRQGNLSSTVSVVGQVEAVQRADLSFDRISGTTKLVSLKVKPGNTVTATQVLATIDPAPYQQALDQVKSALQAAEKTLTDLKTPSTSLQIAQADLAIAKARFQLQQAHDALDKLVRPNIPSLESAVAAAQSALAKAQADVLARQQDTAGKDQLARLVTVEATPAALYSRLEAENYSDAYYQDRLELAFNKMMDARDPRVTNEVQAQNNALQAQVTLRKGEKTLADAQAALAKAQTGGDKLALAQAQVAVQEAQVALLTAQDARRKLDAGAEPSALATAQADLDKKRLALSDAQTALAATQLRAPFDATVLETHASPGDQIAASTAILTLANLKALQVVAAIDETTIRRITADQDVQIAFDAFPGQRFRGKVLAIPLQGALQGGVMVYDVPISLTGADKLPLLVGMTANAQIQVAQAANVLLVPTMALQRVGGQYQVLLQMTDPALPQGAAVAVPVEVGLSDGVNTQITSGLQPGDQVVVQLDATQTTNPFAGPGAPGGQGGQNALTSIIRQFTRSAGR